MGLVGSAFKACSAWLRGVQDVVSVKVCTSCAAEAVVWLTRGSLAEGMVEVEVAWDRGGLKSRGMAEKYDDDNNDRRGTIERKNMRVASEPGWDGVSDDERWMEDAWVSERTV